jgi:hypothetical protein
LFCASWARFVRGEIGARIIDQDNRTNRTMEGRSMRSACTLPLAVLIIVAATPSLAQQAQIGAVVTPKGALQLRAAPPGGLIGLTGQVVGTMEPSQSYKVLDKRSISTVLGGENWLRVQSVTDASKQGWVFTGNNNSPTANVTINSQ